jgi:hypothetical protein
MQTLEILERIFDNSKNIELFEDIRKREPSNFLINSIEYNLVKGAYDDLHIVTSKLVNLTRCFSKDWNDIDKKPDSFYEYGRVSGFGMTDEEMITFADSYFSSNEPKGKS